VKNTTKASKFSCSFLVEEEMSCLDENLRQVKRNLLLKKKKKKKKIAITQHFQTHQKFILSILLNKFKMPNLHYCTNL